jgi:glycine dehydrogenase
MDGANMNAQMGLTSPGMIGADVGHLNLHKTFAIPHGGGGPGIGCIGYKKHLEPFVPGHSVVPVDGRNQNAVSGSPYGNAGVIPVSYSYIKMSGKKGLLLAAQHAILNANYIKCKLEHVYDIKFVGHMGRVAHEVIIDCNSYKEFGITEEDIAKRLIDYGFHAPTMSFPLSGVLMIEPTESENLLQIDYFITSML